MQTKKSIRPIALYLPQFHPIPENDAWWGKGFTEWRNVVKAKPRFKGHYQPHMPADLGYYDLRLEEARLAQEAMAKEYGIYGFCYYHYWFNGKRLLNEPIDRKMKNSKEDLPFMFCWANENWTRAWDGGENEILMKQDYSEEDDINHIRALIPYFKDERYIKVDGKPVFTIYRPKLLPDITKTLAIFRNEAEKAGLNGIHLGFMQSFGVFDQPYTMGFDFAIEFQPIFKQKYKQTSSNPLVQHFLKHLQSAIRWRKKSRDGVNTYADFIHYQMCRPFQHTISPCLTPQWDNSPRRKPDQAFILKNSTPELFMEWLSHIVEKYPWSQNHEKFLFINAWNEWAEGNHLEPCEKWGTSYLEKVRNLLK